MIQTLYIIAFPILIGLLLFVIPPGLRIIKGIISIATCLVTGYLAIRLFGSGDLLFSMGDCLMEMGWQVRSLEVLSGNEKFCSFSLDGLSRLITLFISLLSLLIAVYSLVCKAIGGMRNYYAWFLITLGFSFAAVLSNNLLLFLICWGILGLTLYMLLPGKDEKSSAAAKKTLILIGASDGIMIVGVAFSGG